MCYPTVGLFPTRCTSQRETTTRATPLLHKVASPRQMVWWFLLPGERVSAQNILKLKQLCQQERALAQTYEIAQTFTALIHCGSDKGLNNWYGRVQASGLSEMQSFVRGLQADEAAVRAGLSMRWSQGQVEGTVNKVKLIKRQGYGRANFDLLRLKVLAS